MARCSLKFSVLEVPEIGDKGMSGERVPPVSGGQPDEYPGENVADLFKATQAMQTFGQTGELDPQLTWRVG